MQEPALQPKPSGEIPQDEPIYGKGKDGIAWNIPEYNNLWDSLPIKFKAAIRPDNDWMKELMYKCVNDRKKGKPCEVVTPKNLIIPPNKLENGKYDFGIQIYSDLFNNKLEPSLQNTYLKQFLVRDGVKDYNILKDSMNRLVAKETGFDRGDF
jgi:hypothetical protein